MAQSLKHNTREIHEALESETFNVYLRRASNPQVARRIADARKSQGTFQVRDLASWTWITVDPSDALYLN